MSAPYFPIELKDINAEITFLGMGNKNYSIGTVNDHDVRSTIRIRAWAIN